MLTGAFPKWQWVFFKANYVVFMEDTKYVSKAQYNTIIKRLWILKKQGREACDCIANWLWPNWDSHRHKFNSGAMKNRERLLGLAQDQGWKWQLKTLYNKSLWRAVQLVYSEQKPVCCGDSQVLSVNKTGGFWEKYKRFIILLALSSCAPPPDYIL